MVGQEIEQSLALEGEIVSASEVDTKKKVPYYNFNYVYSFSAVWMFVIGARGLGKTYGAKKIAIRNAIRKGEMFIHLRRYKDEMKNNSMFFQDIAHEFPKYDFRVDGREAQMTEADTRGQEKRDWRTIGYFRSLSTASTEKGGTFPRVTLIIYDEFILEKGYTQYLPEEFSAFFGFYTTVDRNQGRTKVLFLANSVSMMNPYFLKYGFRPKEGEVARTSDGFSICHFAHSKEYTEFVRSTPFGIHTQLVNKEYDEFANSNTFVDNHDLLLGWKTEDAEYQFTLETRTGMYSIWYDLLIDKYFVQEKRPRGDETHYTLMASRLNGSNTLLAYNDKLLQYHRSAYRNGMVIFDCAKSRNTFEDIFTR